MLLRSSSGPILSCVNSQADVVKGSDITHLPHAIYHPPSSPCCSSPPPCHYSSSNTSTNVDSPCKPIQEGSSASQRLRTAQSEGDLATVSKGLACVYAASSLTSCFPDEIESASGNTNSCNKQWVKRNSFQYRGSALCRQDSTVEEREGFEFNSEDDHRGSVVFPVDSFASSVEDNVLELFDGKMNSHLELRDPGLETVLLPKSDRGVLLDGETYTSLSADANGLPVVCTSRGCRPVTRLESEKLSSLLISSGLGLGMGGGCHGGNGRNEHGWSGCPDASDADAHFQSLIKADPQNPLLLRNYAQYLNDVKGDRKMSEEYLERAILECPGDGDVLAQYAKIQWDVHRDQERAETYFDQAVQAAPDDCYVMASYASFLWDSEDSDDAIPSSSSLDHALQGASSAPTLALA